MTGDVELMEHLMFDAEATRGATTSWMKEEFSARRPVNFVFYGELKIAWHGYILDIFIHHRNNNITNEINDGRMDGWTDTEKREI